MCISSWKGSAWLAIFSSMQQKVDKQFADMRELESGTLEQNLRRIDELSRQFEGINRATIQQAQAEIRRTKSELAKALAEKQKDEAKKMSELKADLAEDANAKVSEVSDDLKQTRTELRREVNDINVRRETPVKPAPVVATHTVVPQQPQPVPAPKKTTFWNKLNPFRSHKEKTDVASK